MDGIPPLDLTATPPPGHCTVIDTRWGPLRLHARETPGPAPDAPIAVHLHGLAGSATNWTDLSRQLSGRLRSIAVDLPGFGHSEPPPGFDFGRQAHAHVLARYLDGLGAGPVHLTGNSFGGAVAVELAATRPDLVATLTLISPAMPDLRPDPRRLSDARIVPALLPVVGARARRRLAAVTPHERAERLMRLCFAEPDSVPAHRVAEAAEEFREREALPWAGPSLGRTTTALLLSWLVPPSRSLWWRLRQVAAPTLVVWGLADRVVSARKAPRTAATLPRGRLLVLPRTGHVAQMERPRMVARAVLGLVDADSSW
ncbi:alpha/beta fold hydrolase [Saccharopolyspora rosea]